MTSTLHNYKPTTGGARVLIMGVCPATGVSSDKSLIGQVVSMDKFGRLAALRHDERRLWLRLTVQGQTLHAGRILGKLVSLGRAEIAKLEHDPEIDQARLQEFLKTLSTPE